MNLCFTTFKCNIIGLATDTVLGPGSGQLGAQEAGIRNKVVDKVMKQTMAKIQQMIAKKNDIKRSKWAYLKGMGWVKYQTI